MDSGVYHRSELVARGADDNYLRNQVRNGVLTRVRRGWYATPTADESVVTAIGRGGVLGCASALHHHRLWVPQGLDSLHVRASKHLTGGRRDFCTLPSRPLPATTAVDPIPVALLSASRCMSAEDWIVVCDSALNTLGIDVDELRRAMPQTSRHILDMLDRCDGRSMSGTESITRLRLRAQGFRVEVQPYVEGVGYVDLRVGRLLIECDSKQHHTSAAAYQNDRRRDRKSLIGGWMTIRVTHDDVVFGWDETFADVLAVTRTDRHRIRGRRAS